MEAQNQRLKVIGKKTLLLIKVRSKTIQNCSPKIVFRFAYFQSVLKFLKFNLLKLVMHQKFRHLSYITPFLVVVVVVLSSNLNFK